MKELADELRDSGLCDDRRDLTKADYDFDFANCRPSGAEHARDGLLVIKFDNRSVYEKHLRWDRSGCGGAMVYGPMWSIGPLSGDEIQVVIDSVGGQVVGARERDKGC